MTTAVVLDDARRATRAAPTFRELLGLAVGLALAPIAARLSRARRARMFHPEGCTLYGQVEAHPKLDGEWSALAARLSGPVLARFSGALFRGSVEHLEVLGIALRLRAEKTLSARRLPSDQDLLFATIRSPFTLLLSPFTTNAHDYLRNHYWAVSPFEVGQRRHVKFRLSPLRSAAESRPTSAAPTHERDRALLEHVRRAPLEFRLEARYTFGLGWRTIASLRLLAQTDIDQATLRFSPFQNARGVVPTGFVHALRRATYAASQRARPTETR